MTRYVRTKDRIYEIEDEITITPYLDEGWEKVFKMVDSNECIKEQDIIKQSDNLAELCDRFVYVDTKHNIELYKYMIRKSLCDNDKKYMKMGTEIYGAIWTDKGLIYVAKMDENGKLVLI